MPRLEDFDELPNDIMEIAHEFDVDLRYLVTANHQITMEGIERAAALDLAAMRDSLQEETDRDMVRSHLDACETFYDDLCVIFPELTNQYQAKQFWHVYRNGLLHQGAFSAIDRKKVIMPFGAISGETPRIAYDAVTDTFFVNPIPFSNTVLDFIRNDLATLAAAAATNHEIPSIAQPFNPGGSDFIFNSPPTGNFLR